MNTFQTYFDTHLLTPPTLVAATIDVARRIEGVAQTQAACAVALGPAGEMVPRSSYETQRLLLFPTASEYGWIFSP